VPPVDEALHERMSCEQQVSWVRLSRPLRRIMTNIQPHNRQPIAGVKDTIAISSGKGGVGKSTMAVNLAVALSKRGLKIGLADTDMYGPNIPGMLGSDQKPQVNGDTQRLQPPTAHGIKTVSMGLLLDPGTPVIWRGPMLAKMVTQFLFNVDWGELDLLLLDLPPGTGDVQITLTQSAPLTGAVIVTTPSPLALEDVRRGVEMFRQSEVPILGLIENMSYFECPGCQTRTPIFGGQGGEHTAETFHLPLLGRVPIDIQMREGADAGTPLVAGNPGGATATILDGIAGQLVDQLAAGVATAQV
jgi:ATP-binding protein involved in chromosome partitioning